jgi:hypothetical protein
MLRGRNFFNSLTAQHQMRKNEKFEFARKKVPGEGGL